ncbi:MAG: hypothetical protein WCH46_06085 [bacterium]
MSIVGELASALGKRDEKPNQELAKRIVAKSDSRAIAQLIALLDDENKAIQSDSIKVLYEIGESKPALIAEYAANFVILLNSKNNRLQWGAMTALDTITGLNPKPILLALPRILQITDEGSVITRDHAVGILIKLCLDDPKFEKGFEHLIKQLATAPTNQLPMYAERMLPIVTEKRKAKFMQTLQLRLPKVEQESKRKRIEKVISKLQ